MKAQREHGLCRRVVLRVPQAVVLDDAAFLHSLHSILLLFFIFIVHVILVIDVNLFVVLWVDVFFSLLRLDAVDVFLLRCAHFEKRLMVKKRV